MTRIDTSDFKRLIGKWKTTGQVVSDGGTVSLDGTDSYEFILDGHFILHKANVVMGTEKSETAEVISISDVQGKAKMQYYNNKGESGVMIATLNQNDFLIDGDGIKFRGKINSENSVIAGSWYLRTERSDWAAFIHLKLEKQILTTIV